MVKKKLGLKWCKICLCGSRNKWISGFNVKWLSWVFGTVGVYFFIRGFFNNSWGSAILGLLFLGAADIIQIVQRIKRIEKQLGGN